MTRQVPLRNISHFIAFTALLMLSLAGVLSGSGRAAIASRTFADDVACRGDAAIRDPWPEFVAPGLYVGPVGFVAAQLSAPWTAEYPYRKLLLVVDAQPGERLRIEGYDRDGRRLRFSHGSEDGRTVELVDIQVPDRNHPDGFPQDLPGVIEFPGPGCFYAWIAINDEAFGPIGIEVT